MDPRSLEDSGGGSAGVFLHAGDAVQLGYAAADRLARDAGLRCLAIKGPVPAVHGLRRPGASVDVDVLVTPAEVDALLARFAAWGWTPVSSDETGRLLAPHSVTLGHPQWPITIDLHHRFPGFFAEPEVVFDALWEDRATIRVAECSVVAAGRDGSTLIAALHALRDPERVQSANELDQLKAARADDDASQKASLARLASVTGAVDAAAGFLIDVGLAISAPPSDPESFEQWRLRTELGDVRGLPWLIRLRDAPWGRRWGLLRRLIITDDDVTLMRYGMSPGGEHRLRAHRRRLASLLGDTPRLLRTLMLTCATRRMRRG